MRAISSRRPHLCSGPTQPAAVVDGEFVAECGVDVEGSVSSRPPVPAGVVSEAAGFRRNKASAAKAIFKNDEEGP